MKETLAKIALIAWLGLAAVGGVFGGRGCENLVRERAMEDLKNGKMTFIYPEERNIWYQIIGGATGLCVGVSTLLYYEKDDSKNRFKYC